jgi:rhamnulokinase
MMPLGAYRKLRHLSYVLKDRCSHYRVLLNDIILLVGKLGRLVYHFIGNTYLTNIMGLWMIQSVRNKLAPDRGYGEICEEASKETISSVVDAQDEAFLAPADMVKAIQDKCQSTGQEVPETLPQLAAVIYNSLAKCYADKLKEIEELTGKKYDRIHIIGGGSNAGWLNELSAKYAGVPVYAGPGEATALGNVLSQMIEKKLFDGIDEARRCVADSFEIRVYN